MDSCAFGRRATGGRGRWRRLGRRLGVAPGDGRRWLRGLWSARGPTTWEEFLRRLREDRLARAQGEASQRVRLTTGLRAVPPSEAVEVAAFIGANPGMIAHVALDLSGSSELERSSQTP